MKKKKLLTFISALTLCAMLFNLCGCFLFNGDSAYEDYMTTITLHGDGEDLPFEAKYGRKVETTSLTKKGYYLKGYYANPDGTNRYFDSAGKSLTEWNKDFPVEFYPAWEEIGKLTYRETALQENPQKITLQSNVFSHKFELSPELVNAAKGNMDQKLLVKCSYKFTCTRPYESNRVTVVIWFTNADTSGETYGETSWVYQEPKMASGEYPYIERELSAEIPAGELLHGNLFLKFKASMNGYKKCIKNISLSISFISPEN